MLARGGAVAVPPGPCVEDDDAALVVLFLDHSDTPKHGWLRFWH